ncbi:unnamed protein product [marine sediment metagenome]|uniref:Uncharacterized protein n=1 Tax=marine sediment metagenome TaxID=412755 RepID=X1JAT3_9ZZZZ
MDWGIVGTITGLLAILSVAYAIGRYSGKIDDLIQMKDEVSDSLVKVDTLWELKDGISAAIIKIDTLWRIYIEESLIRHSNPGGTSIMLPDELKNEIKTLLNNDSYIGKVNEPTLLVIDKVGIERFSAIARGNKAELGQVLAELNTYVFLCLRGS